ncbi:hypothetical protein EB155_05320 [archaeon]|nr:hypothetical protein [archaeon]
MLNLTNVKLFCELNEIGIEDFVKECFNKGYQIEKYGLLTIDGQTVIEKEVIKEIIKEVPVEKIIEKEIIKEVEVPVEVIKEIEKIVEVEKEVVVEVEKPIEVIVEKEVYVTDEDNVNELLLKIQQLENKKPEVIEKEIIVEKPIEIIKEVEVVKEVENKDKLNQLQNTIQSLRDEITKKDNKILHLEENLLELKKVQGPTKAQYMRSSNLNDNLYR